MNTMKTGRHIISDNIILIYCSFSVPHSNSSFSFGSKSRQLLKALYCSINLIYFRCCWISKDAQSKKIFDYMYISPHVASLYGGQVIMLTIKSLQLMY